MSDAEIDSRSPARAAPRATRTRAQTWALAGALALGCSLDEGDQTLSSVRLRAERPPAKTQANASGSPARAERSVEVGAREEPPLSPAGAAPSLDVLASPRSPAPDEAASPSRSAVSRSASALPVAPTSSGSRAPAPDAPPATPTSRVELAPGANEEFDPAALADVQAALSAENEDAFATLIRKDALTRKEKRVRPKSCRTWRELRRSGFVPKGALGEQVNAGALVRCGALEFLARAKPSRVSHVPHALGGTGADGLPAIVASATCQPALRARRAAANRGLSLAEFLPDAQPTPSPLLGRVVFSEPAAATTVTVNAEAWGDVNADGVEDLLLSVLNLSDDDTYFEMRLIELTRRAPSAPLVVLAVST